jgi:endonuclease/exonuclease/phosphatase family metal-dependent hydrolase
MSARGAARLLVLVGLLVGCLGAPVSAAPGRPRAPWVVASTPDSVTLTWTSTGASRYRVAYARSVAGVARSSAPSRTTSGRTTRLVVDGLRPGTTYCFTVRAVSGARAGSLSAAHCHSTSRPTAASTVPLSVVTYNICGVAKNCGRWTAKRQRAVLAQIDRSRADVVALQEMGRRRYSMAGPLRARGYRQIGYDADDLLFYRASRFEIQVDASMRPVCRDRPVDAGIDTSRWTPVMHDQRGASYIFVDDRWFVSAGGCPLESVRVNARYGNPPIGHEAMLTYAILYDRLTGRTPVFMNTHLKNGKDRRAVRVRREQVATLLSQFSWIVGGRPVILMGDFNSDATRPDDGVGRALARAGLVDTYQNSTRYTRPYINSFNGFQRLPRRDERWGGHIDRVFTSAGVGATRWEVVARLAHGRYVGPRASDHNPVRVSLQLP